MLPTGIIAPDFEHYSTPDTRTILSELLGLLHKMGDPIDFYFDHVNDGEILNPFLSGEQITMANNEALPPEFFKGFGIHTLILDTLHGRLSLSEKKFTDKINKEAENFRWRSLKDDLILDDLNMLFKNTQIVEFDDWSDVQNGSDLWDNLRRNVIMPLKRRDFHFVFYLGDSTKKFVFELDEMLDIMSDYALHGRVTLVLNEQNAGHLWELLYGRDVCMTTSTLPGLNEKCRSLFDLMDISHMIIDSSSSRILYSREQQFEMAVRKSIGTSKGSRKHFDNGYMLGLILKAEISHCLALGMAVSGMYTEDEYKPDSKKLFSYIENWMGEIESPFKTEARQKSVA